MGCGLTCVGFMFDLIVVYCCVVWSTYDLFAFDIGFILYCLWFNFVCLIVWVAVLWLFCFGCLLSLLFGLIFGLGLVLCISVLFCCVCLLGWFTAYD